MDPQRPTQKTAKSIGQKTVTRADLVDAVYSTLGLSKSESTSLVECVLKSITKALVDEGEVKISAFGSFHVRSKRARIGRNPKTGIEVTISPRKVLTFKPSPVLKDSLSL